MIYKPGDTVTLSQWSAPISESASGLQINGVKGGTPSASGAILIQQYDDGFISQTGVPFEARVLSGSLSGADCTLQLAIPSVLKDAYTGFRHRYRIARAAATGGLRVCYLDVLRPDLNPHRRPWASCCLDAVGRLWVAVVTPAGIEIRRFGATLASVEVVHNFPNAVRGTLGFGLDGRMHFLCNIGDDPASPTATWDRADLHAFSSTDFGLSWQELELPPLVAHAQQKPFEGKSTSSDRSPSRGAWVYALCATEGTALSFRLDWTDVITPVMPGATPPPTFYNQPYGLAFRGQKWEMLDYSGTTKALKNFLTRGYSIPETGMEDRQITLNNWGICHTPQGVYVRSWSAPGALAFYYDGIRNGSLTAPNSRPPVTNRTLRPLGAIVPGSQIPYSSGPNPYRETPTHTLFHAPTGELHLTDGLAYWASSPDMSRTWRTRH